VSRLTALAALCFVLAACGGQSATEEATDNARVAGARLSMHASIAAHDGEELLNTAQYIERVRGVGWSDSAKRAELERTASLLVGTACFDCYLLIKDDLGG